MKLQCIRIMILFIIVLQVSTQSAKVNNNNKKLNKQRAKIQCQSPNNDQHICYCGKANIPFDRYKGEKCINGVIFSKQNTLNHSRRPLPLRMVSTPLHRSTRDDNLKMICGNLLIKKGEYEEPQDAVPLKNVTVEAWIDTFAADVTINQVFVNEENNTIEAIYVFPIEENAAVYSFTAQIDNRTITAELKEKSTAEQEYKTAVSQGRTAVLLRQSEETLDTFTINVGSLAPGKTCVITIKYVSELEMVDGSSIRFVVPTTIAPRYNPKMGQFQSPDNSPARYVKKTPYSLSFQAHIARGDQYQIDQVANLSHAVNAVITKESIDISMSSIALDRDIILDIDLPDNRPTTLINTEKDPITETHGVLFSFAPRLSDFLKISEGHNETNTEFIFIVDCSGSMSAENRIPLAREAMLLFLRSLPLDSHFNIIRFGSNFDVLFKTEAMTAVYNETTAKKAEKVIRSMEADFGGTEILEPLKHVKEHPPVRGRSRQIFLLTDGEVSNTNEVIDLSRSMSASTRIFSIGLGDSSSRSLVKGLARATNGYFTFIPPNAKVDTYVASQFSRALQPSIVDARLEWHGLSDVGQQAPKTIPPLYINDRVLIYQLFDGEHLSGKNITVDLMVGSHRLDTFKVPTVVGKSRSTIRRLAAKALIQELQHSKLNGSFEPSNTTKEEIKELSLLYKILSPYTAFVGVEKNGPVNDNANQSQVRHIPIQLNKDAQQSMPMHHQYYGSFGPPAYAAPQAYQSPVMYGMPLAMGSFGGRPGVSATWRQNYIQMPVNKLAPSRGHSGGLSGPSGPPGVAYDSAIAEEEDDAQEAHGISTTRIPFQSKDPVRWLIDRQSFNGAWIFDDQEVSQLTNGSTLSSLKTTCNRGREVVTTALGIAVLESKHVNQKNLWQAVVDKARKQIERQGLTKDQINALIDEIKNQL